MGVDSLHWFQEDEVENPDTLERLRHKSAERNAKRNVLKEDAITFSNQHSKKFFETPEKAEEEAMGDAQSMPKEKLEAARQALNTLQAVADWKASKQKAELKEKAEVFADRMDSNKTNAHPEHTAEWYEWHRKKE